MASPMPDRGVQHPHQGAEVQGQHLGHLCRGECVEDHLDAVDAQQWLGVPGHDAVSQ
jgi:hypothetical protein